MIVIGVSTLLGPLPVPFDERVKARFADVVNETVVVTQATTPFSPPGWTHPRGYSKKTNFLQKPKTLNNVLKECLLFTSVKIGSILRCVP